VGVLVEHQAVVVDAAIEVDGELRESRDGLCRAEDRGAAVALHHVAREVEVAIEPRVQERRAVDLHLERAEVGGRALGIRLEVQSGRVGVRTHDAKVRVGARGGDEGDERPTARDETFRSATREVGQFARCVEPHEAGVEQPARSSSDDMVRCGGCVEKLSEVVDFRQRLAGRCLRRATWRASARRLGCRARSGP